MTRLINALSPEDAQRIRDRIAGKPLPPAIAKPKKAQPVKCLVSQYFSYNPRTNSYLIQLPEFLSQPREFVPPPSMSATQVRKVLYARRNDYEKLRDSVGVRIERYMPNGVPGLKRIEYVRLSSRAGNPATEMDDDNLSACFKPVRDAVCAYVRWPHEWREHVERTLGQADGWLKQQGVTWIYRQAKCAANPRLHGIQIVLHCAPHSSE
jgi:hypothetical protein